MVMKKVSKKGSVIVYAVSELLGLYALCNYCQLVTHACFLIEDECGRLPGCN